MELLFRLCSYLSLGVIIGFLVGGVKAKLATKPYSKKQIELTQKIINKLAILLKYITFCVLVIGFIWCVYFLTLGIISPAQSDYANNMAELIVSVLTVISIIFAFVEFLRRKDDK